ncbi:MAG: hypothetical protein WDW36_002881 [Sanguina aurantia]
MDVDWHEFEVNHRDEWLACLRKTFSTLDVDGDGLLQVDELIAVLRDKLPEDEVNSAVQESLVEAAVLDSDGLSFEDFVKLLRSGSIDGTSSSTAALEIYDPRVSSVHRGRLAEEAGLVAAQQQQQQQQASPMSPTASCAGMSVGGNGEHLTEGDGSHTLLTTLFSGGRTSPTEGQAPGVSKSDGAF